MQTILPKSLTRHAALLLLGLIACAFAFAGGAYAREPALYWLAQADDWQSLSETEQRALGGHRDAWRQYSPDQRQRLRAGVQRYQTLSPDERRDVIRGRERYQSLQPQEREQLRERYQKSNRGRENRSD